VAITAGQSVTATLAAVVQRAARQPSPLPGHLKVKGQGSTVRHAPGRGHGP
jgi:hypothetical protein